MAEEHKGPRVVEFPKPEVNPGLQARIDELQEAVDSGDVIAICVVCATRDGGSSSGFTQGEGGLQLIGGMEYIKGMILKGLYAMDPRIPE